MTVFFVETTLLLDEKPLQLAFHFPPDSDLSPLLNHWPAANERKRVLPKSHIPISPTSRFQTYTTKEQNGTFAENNNTRRCHRRNDTIRPGTAHNTCLGELAREQSAMLCDPA